MKKYKIPVTYEVWGIVEVEAKSLEEALKYFDENEDIIELPINPEYIDGSFKREEDEIFEFNNNTL